MVSDKETKYFTKADIKSFPEEKKNANTKKRHSRNARCRAPSLKRTVFSRLVLSTRITSVVFVYNKKDNTR